jgi:A/G-specific adenine glycosylase
METKRQKIVQNLLAWFATNARDLPWRRTRDPYGIWVSEIMLQQTQVKTVLRYWERWMRALPTLKALARARPEKIHKLWEGLGYYTRVRNMRKAAEQILERHEGQFPHEFEQILVLPGIGRYTAGAICSIAFNQPKPILDGNVTRVLTRLFGVSGDPRGKQTNARLWRLAEELVCEAWRGEGRGARREGTQRPSPLVPRPSSRSCSHLNQSLMELGALVCTARQPQCGACPVDKFCVAHRQGRVDELPQIGPRVKATSRRFVGFVAQTGETYLVRQRPAGAINGHLWEFPNVEVTAGDGDLRKAAQQALSSKPSAVHPFGVINHSITRYRIRLEVYRVEGLRRTKSLPGRWCAAAELKRLAFTSAHRRILEHLLESGPLGALVKFDLARK